MSSINDPMRILPETAVSSTGGSTAQYESQGVTPKTGGKSRRRGRRRRTTKRTTKRSKKRVSFMTKWMA